MKLPKIGLSILWTTTAISPLFFTSCSSTKDPTLQSAEEGIVLLKNNLTAKDAPILPLINKRINVFGNAQYNYYKAGGGAGGIVNFDNDQNIINCFNKSNRVRINENLASYYHEQNTNTDQPEVDIHNDLLQNAKAYSDTALVVLRHWEEEGHDVPNIPTSEKQNEGFSLSTNVIGDGNISEIVLLNKITENFANVIVVLNSGYILDMSQLNSYGTKIKAILQSWYGGKNGPQGLVNVLTGVANPSGKLNDTITQNGINDYPSTANFGTLNNNYVEDIYVGYRYFSTFGSAKNKILYPFGYGLSYTTFNITTLDTKCVNDSITFNIKVTNTGRFSGKEVVQVYYDAPNGALGNPKHQLAAYVKTKELKPNQTQKLTINISLNNLACYNDKLGVNSESWILQQGDYDFFVGNNSLNPEKVYTYTQSNTTIVQQLSEECKPRDQFQRWINNGTGEPALENVPIKTSDVPSELENHLNQLSAIDNTGGDKGISLVDVYKNKNVFNNFLGQLSNSDLAYLLSGIIDDVSPPTSGTAAIIGGTMANLRNFGIPSAVNADGAGGVKCDKPTTAIPCATMLACTFNNELVQKNYDVIGKQAKQLQIDDILAPGMNIHRNPLCGRNFEYFSEDPLVTGMMAASAVKGLQTNGVSATIKHFAANNQELHRFQENENVSERCLREIHLRGFQIAINQSHPWSLMTSYNSLNERHTQANFELVNNILRDEWGYDNLVMTDWWGWSNQDGDGQADNYPDSDLLNLKGYPLSVRSTTDIRMGNVSCKQTNIGYWYGRILDSLNSSEAGHLELKEAQLAARRILEFCMKTNRFASDNSLHHFDYTKDIKNVNPWFSIN